MKYQQVADVSILLILCLMKFSFGIECPSSVKGLFGQEIVIGCDFDSELVGVYWFDERDDREPLVRLEDGFKGGRGYAHNNYNVTSDGSLVIKNAKWNDTMVFTVHILDSKYQEYSFQTKVLVIEHCPSNQSGLAGEEAVIVCHFKPYFVAVYWFESTDHVQPLIRLEDSFKSGRGLSKQEYHIKDNGSLIIRRVTNGYKHAFKVLLLKANSDHFTYNVNFQADNPCGIITNPLNGIVNQTAKIAVFICDNGYRLVGSSHLQCPVHDSSNTYQWSRDVPRCVIDVAVRVTGSPTTTDTISVNGTLAAKTSTPTALTSRTEKKNGNGIITKMTSRRPSFTNTAVAKTTNLETVTSTIREEGNNLHTVKTKRTTTESNGSHGNILQISWTVVSLTVICHPFIT